MAGRKRKAAATTTATAVTEAETATDTRRSRRISSSAVAQKSSYFEADSESELEPRAKRQAKTAKSAAATGGKRAKKKTKVESESEDDDDAGGDYLDDEHSEDDKAEQGGDDDDDDEFDEDATPKVTFIPIPKLRDTGGVEYADDRLHANTLAFLKDLKANNKRSWLKCASPFPNALFFPLHKTRSGLTQIQRTTRNSAVLSRIGRRTPPD